MQRIKIKFWRRSSRSIGDKPGGVGAAPSSSSASASAPSSPTSSQANNDNNGATAAAGGRDAATPPSAPTTVAFSVSDGKVNIPCSDESALTSSCRLCLCDIPQAEMFTLASCNCSYCTRCCQQYVRVMIMEGSVLNITCPDALCTKGGNFKTSDIEKLTDRKTYSRYRRLKFEREVELDPLRSFCPQVGCDTICHIRHNMALDADAPSEPAPPPSTARAVCCPTCNHMFCSKCKLKWHGSNQTCDEAMSSGRIEDLGILFSNGEDAQIKRCPLCHVPIERDDGCAQMMCKRCKHLFCWYCQESLDDDFLLLHYDKGPCKNKLGHSRASVIWHRAQVVGIFAGVGVLMLVASPFLLLAAPCILICKCNSMPRMGEDETTSSPDDGGFSSS